MDSLSEHPWKQTIESADMSLALKTTGKYVKVGNYGNLIFNHDVDKNLIFEICFKKGLEKKKDLKEIGRYPPGNICLTFHRGKKDEIELESFEIADIYRRSMLHRKLMPDDYYSFKFINQPDKMAEGIPNDEVLRDKPKHFLFDGQSIIQSLFLEKGEPDEHNVFQELKITGFYASLFRALEYTSLNITELLKNSYYSGFVSTATDDDKSFFKACSSTTAIFLKCY